jgi:magnesium-protoporphyrin O-methyltransferase
MHRGGHIWRHARPGGGLLRPHRDPTWERLTSDAPVSRIRQTVREGRDRMRATMLARLPEDLGGLRVLDAGCGPGVMTAELAARGATVVAADISPQLVEIAAKRLPEADRDRVTFHAGDMLADELGSFDYVLAMDSLIYYTAADIDAALLRFERPHAGGGRLHRGAAHAVPHGLLGHGQALPARGPLAGDAAARPSDARAALPGRLDRIGRVARGFYISECLEYRP